MFWKILLFVAICSGSNALVAQNNVILDGTYSPEVKSYWVNGMLFLTMKEYHDWGKGNSEGMLRYTDLPLGATEFEVGGDLFNTRLIAVKNNQMLWSKDIGANSISSTTALYADSHAVYTGEKVKGSRQLNIYRFDHDGKVIWSVTLDSLDAVHEIFANNWEHITCLVSYSVWNKVYRGGNYSVQKKNIYHTVRINKITGAIVSKKVNEGPTHFCSEGFSNPQLQCHWVHYFFKKDTLVYSLTDTLKMITLADVLLSGKNVVLTHGTESEVLAIAQTEKQRGSYAVLQRWASAPSVKKIVELPLPKGAKMLKIIKRSDGGFLLVYSDDGSVGTVILDANAEVLEQKKEVFKKNMVEAISDFFLEDDGSLHLLGLVQVDGKRVLVLY
jgi:hypothetical protein